MKKVRKIVISVVCCVLVAALIVGGIVFWGTPSMWATC